MANSSAVSPEFSANLYDKYFHVNGVAGGYAPIFVDKSSVPQMKAEFEAAGVAKGGIKFSWDDLLFKLNADYINDNNIRAVADALAVYSYDSAGFDKWKEERSKDAKGEEILKRVIKSEAVQNGYYVDKMSLNRDVVADQLRETGVDDRASEVVAGLLVKIMEGGQRGEDTNSIAADLLEKYANDPAAVESAYSEQFESIFDEVGELDQKRFDVLKKYLSESEFKIADGLEPSVVEDFGHGSAIKVEIALEDGRSSHFHMAFDFNTDKPVAVYTSAQDNVFEKRKDIAEEIIAPFFKRLQRDFQATFTRSPDDANSVYIKLMEGDTLHKCVVKFDKDEKLALSSEIGILINGKEVNPETLKGYAKKDDRHVAHLATMTGITAPAERVVLTVPYSERDEFESIKATTGATTKYNSKAESGYGRPGGWELLKGDPQFFAKWTTAEAHAKFVQESDARKATSASLPKVAVREVQEQSSPSVGGTFGHFAKGFMMPSDPVKVGRFFEGFTDDYGRVRKGLESATPDEIREIARNTSNSYIELDRRESTIRLEYLTAKNPDWIKRYANLGDLSHEERIDALMSVAAKDGKPGFRALNHEQSRHLWKTPAGEVGLSSGDKTLMSSFYRGFNALNELYKEKTGKNLEFSLLGRQLGSVSEKLNIEKDTSIVAAAGQGGAKKGLLARDRGYDRSM